MSMIGQRDWPVSASQQATWQRGPIDTMYSWTIAGTVREQPWFGVTSTG
jgi:hypothetical protein